MAQVKTPSGAIVDSDTGAIIQQPPQGAVTPPAGTQPPAAPAAPTPSQTPAPTQAMPTPATPQPLAVQPAGQPYTVQAGDSLSAIATKFGVPISAITGYRSGDPNKIFPGETLSIGGMQQTPVQGGVPQPTPTNTQPNPDGEPVDDELGKLYMQAFMETMRDGSFAGATPEAPGSDLMSQYGLNPSYLSYGFDTNPTQTVKDIVAQVMEATALPEAKGAITTLAKEIEDIQNERDQKYEEIDNDPFISAGTKRDRKAKLDEKYEKRIANRTNYLKLVESAYDDARQEAQFAATTAINLYDRNRNFDQSRLEFAITQSEKRLEAIRDMTKTNPSEFKEVSGGLYNLRTGEWVIEPTNNQLLGGLSKDQRTYLNQIQDNARQDENIKTFPAIRASFETARSAVSKRNGPGDLTLLRMLAKITDPTTGVLSGEFETFEDAQSTLDKIGIKLTTKMWQGDRLTDEARLQFYQQAKDIYGQRLNAYQNSYDFFNSQATDAGLPNGSVMPTYVAPNTKQGAKPQGGTVGWY